MVNHQPIISEKEELEVFVDGACLGNPGPGGYAVLIRSGGREEILAGGEPYTTNNRMELKALLCALTHFKEPKKIKVYTDSEYLLKGLTEWLPRWQKRNFRTSSGSRVKNLDLWKELAKLVSYHQVEFVKVKAHSGHPENERVDRLAKEWAKRWLKNQS